MRALRCSARTIVLYVLRCRGLRGASPHPYWSSTSHPLFRLSRAMSRQFSIVDEPRGAVYRGFLDFAIRCCDSLSLVVNRQLGKAEFVDELTIEGQSFLQRMEAHVISITEALEWPGTIQLEGASPAMLCKYRLNEDTLGMLQSAVSHLYGWLQPHLPEDLCLYTPDGGVWLGSTAYERDAFVRLTDASKDDLVERLPQLA